MDAVPMEVKREALLLFLTSRERVNLALTSRGEARWIRPFLAFMALSAAEKVAFLRLGRCVALTGGVILEALAQHHDPLALLSLLDHLPDRDHSALKEGIRTIVEDRLRDRSYRKLIKGTLVRVYLEHLTRHGKDATRFLDTIRSPEVLSQAVEQHVLLQKDKLPRRTLDAWVARIPDRHIHDRVLRRVQSEE